MDLERLFHPRSIAVVGATDRAGAFGSLTMAGLDVVGYEGSIWPVNPGRETVHGLPCHPSLGELPGVPDAVVVATPAETVPNILDQAGEIGCGGAVVYGAGFAELPDGVSLQRELVETAQRHQLPVCGPNGNGFVSPANRISLWGDALYEVEAGHIGLVSQSGNLAVNALGLKSGLRLHTVVSCGNQAVLEAADYLEFLAGEPELRSIVLYLEDDGDGPRLCDGLAACAERGVRVAVLKVGTSSAGAAAAAAHTGALAGDQRAFKGLIEEAGAIWAEDVHDLLELGKALALPGSPKPGGLAVLTCSGGDSALAADEAWLQGVELPALAEATKDRLRESLPAVATIANPLDYTAMIWGETDTLAEIIATTGADPEVGRVLVYYDEAAEMAGEALEGWEAALQGIIEGARRCEVPVMMSSTIPELLQRDSVLRLAEVGAPGVGGLRTGVVCAAALMREPGDPARVREIGAAARAAAAVANGDGAWLAEHEAKQLLRDGGIPVVAGRVAADEEDAVRALSELGDPVALKLSAPEIQHKTELGAMELWLRKEDEVRDAYRRLSAIAEGALLIEAMAPHGVELLVAAIRGAVVPALVVGLGGVWAEIHDDVAVIPLPASPERVERALRGLRGASLLTGGRARRSLDVATASQLASGVGDLLLSAELDLVELNPVFVREDGAVAVDAVARTRGSARRSIA